MLSRDDIVTLLDELATELEAQGTHGDLFLVGGAAMAVAYSRRRATRDLDAIFEPKQVIYDAAQRVGDRPGLAVRIASPRYLFAMKVLAARVERDEDDLRLLYELCGFRSVKEALDHVESTYPHQPIPPRAQYLLQELVPPPAGTA